MIIRTWRPWSLDSIWSHIFFKVTFVIFIMKADTHGKGNYPNSVRDFQVSSGWIPALPIALNYSYQARTIWSCKQIHAQLFLCQIVTKRFGTICCRTQLSTLMAYTSRVNQLRRNVQLSVLLFLLYIFFYNTKQEFVLWFPHCSDFTSVLPSDSLCKCEIWNGSFCGQWQNHCGYEGDLNSQ